MRTPCRTQSMEKLEDTDRLRRRFRVVGYAFSLLLTVLVLFRLMRSTVALFHWAERRIDRDSPLHMLAFLAVTLPFNLGLPIPVVHQAWSVAIGCFFGWRAFPMLFLGRKPREALLLLLGWAREGCVGAGGVRLQLEV